MDNPDTLAPLGTQDTGRIQKKKQNKNQQKTNIQHRKLKP